MTDAYFRLTIGSNTFTFIGENVSQNMGRETMEMPLPYVKNQMIYDQVSTVNEIQLTGKVQTGSGYPYATPKAARTAILALFPDDIISTVTLEAGTWNGSSFSADTSRSWNLPDGSTTMLVGSFNLSETVDETDRLTVTINFKVGDVLA